MGKATPAATPQKSVRIPTYRRHATGQAFVQVKGKRIYLGRHGTPESRQRYQEEIEKLDTPEPAYSLQAETSSYTVVELSAAYLDFCEGYYLKNGAPTESAGEVKRALETLCRVDGKTRVIDFGPRKLKHLQQVLVQDGLSRSTVNDRIRIMRRAFRWGASEELVPAVIFQTLDTVEGLRQGRTTAPDKKPILPVLDEVVDRTAPFLSPVVADMVEFQRLTGARPGEVVIIRPMDVDRTEDIWKYVPERHKTEHHGHKRVVYIGPKSQDVLRKYLLRSEDAPCFSPAESERVRLAEVHQQRKTPLSCGNKPGSNRRRWPKRKLGQRYTVASYRRAITRAVDKLNKHLVRKAEDADEPAPEPVPNWFPNQLRHSAATKIRHTCGLEAAQVALGHRNANITQTYAERDERLGIEVARKLG